LAIVFRIITCNIARRNDNITVIPKPSILNELPIKASVINNMKPLIINKNNPKLTIVKGNVNKTITGLTMALTMERIALVSIAVPIPSIETDVKIFAKNSSNPVVISTFIIHVFNFYQPLLNS
jgi:hypothetical protein